MNCERFDAWLDDGQPEGYTAAARDHARSCPRCQAALRAAAEIEASLAAFPDAAPGGFAERVMARIVAPAATRAMPVSERVGRAEGAWARRFAATQPLAWWVDAAAQPATVLACAVASLAFWQRDALWRLAAEFASGPWEIPGLAIREALRTPEVMTGLAVAVLPLAALVAWALYHAAERWTGRVARRGLSHV